MRIKRFIAADMRSALKMVRDEQGAEAVILSSNPTADGIEVVAATDYDEALVHQALRAAAPAQYAKAPQAAPAAGVSLPAVPSLSGPAIPATTVFASASESAATSPGARSRESFASRARAVFRIGEPSASENPAGPTTEPTLAELIGNVGPAGLAADPAAALAAPRAAAPAVANTVNHAPAPTPVPEHFKTMMAALAEPAAIAPALPAAAVDTTPVTAPSPVATPVVETIDQDELTPPPAQPAESLAATAATPAPTSSDMAPAASDPESAKTAMHAIAAPDPGITAMREELTSMRQMIEREMGQFTVERLRGSPARAAAYDILLGYGCDESLAQTIASKLNPSLSPEQVRAPILAELARSLTITRSEPIEDGGVLALIGPTGAGKTTTIAKLAARFAARHRARDVAMVTTDNARPGAIEQLHAHGRRLGITVCEAQGAQGLAQTLEQLQDYPLVLVDTTGYGARDRALLGQITWLRATGQLHSLLVLPASAHPHDLNELVRRYRIASAEGLVLTKTDETGRLGAALSVAVRNGLSLTYTTHGQDVHGDLEAANASNLVLQLEKLRRAADNPFVTEDHHAVA